MRTRRHEGVLLLCLGLLGGVAGADESDERPMPQLDGPSSASEPGSGAQWRNSTRIGKPAARPREEPRAPEPKDEPGAEGDEALPAPAPAAPPGKARYHGVAPGGAELPPHPPKLPLGKGPQRLTWPGFQIKDGRPTLFLQLSGPVEYSVSERRGEVLITLHDTVVPLRNNLRPLLVQDFNTPVKQVRFDRKKNTVTAVVMVKGSVAHTERLEAAENGYRMLVVQFSPMPAEPSAAPAAAKAPAPGGG